MNIKSFGLDIGATTMKAVWLTADKNGFLLKAALKVPTPQRGMLSESVFDQEEMIQAIRKLVEEAKLNVQLVNVALPENQVYTKIVEMPVLSDKELSSAIYWEAEQYIPVPLKTMTLDWKVLKRPQNQPGAKMEVLLVGAPTALIDKYYNVLSAVGLSINAVETEILSVIRAVVVGKDFPTSLIVHIGAMSTSLAVVKDSIVLLAYHIAIGGTAISRAIAADFGFSIPQAEEYKKTYGVSRKTLGGKIGQATEPILMSIVAEVKKAIAFFSEKYKNEVNIKQIILSGGTAKLPEIDLFFAEHSEIETVIVDPWKILVSQEVPKEILDNATDYTIAVGLAMRDYE